MKKISFSTTIDGILLKDNTTQLKPNSIVAALVCAGLIVVFYFEIKNTQFPKNPQSVILIILMLAILIIALTYNLHAIFSKRILELAKKEEGYIVKENGKQQTSIITEIIKKDLTSADEKGYLIAVRDVNGKMFTLFEEVLEADSIDLVAFLSTEIALPVNGSSEMGSIKLQNKTILFSKEANALLLRYNPKKVKITVIYISSTFLGIEAVLYLLTFGGKASHDSGDFIPIVALLSIYVIAIASYLYSIFLRWHVELIKINNSGYKVKKNNKIKTDIIKMLVKTHDVGKYNEGYSIAVIDTNDCNYKLFEGLSEEVALELTVVISTEINVPIERVESRY